MSRALIAPVLIGTVGVAILVSLGNWQLQRLAWKEGVLAEIDSKIQSEPTEFEKMAAPSVARFVPVVARGRTVGPELHVLVSHKKHGAGYKVIQAFQIDGGGRILLDLGFVPVAAKDDERIALVGEIHAVLHQPDERTDSTPENDPDRNIWFARDVFEMAKVLDTLPVLAVLSETSGLDPSVTPLPVDSSAIPNDHREYAITWFSLAGVWFGMTVFWLWRIRRKDQTRG